MSDNMFGEEESVDSDVDETTDEQVVNEEGAENSAPSLPMLPPPLPVNAVPMAEDAEKKSLTILGMPMPLAIALGLGVVGIAAWYLSLPKKRTEDLDDVGDDDEDEDYEDDEEDEEDDEEVDPDEEEEEVEEEYEGDEDVDDGEEDEDLPDDGEDEEGE